MNVVVLGAGAVGCYFGARLAQAGHSVSLIGRPSHVAAINAGGLKFETQGETFYIRLTAFADTHAVDRPDLVLVCVKSTDTETAANDLRGHLAPQTIVMSLQNGVDNAERLASALGHPAIASVVYVGCEMAGPGHVRHHGRGELLIGASSGSLRLAEILSAAGIPTTVSEEIAVDLWSKLIVNCAYNALSAIGDICYGPMMATEGVRDVIHAVIGECAAVAQACGVQVPADVERKTLALAESMPAQMSSTAQDLARGKRSEIEFLNGYVVRMGKTHGVPTPTNLALLVAIRLAEKGRLPH